MVARLRAHPHTRLARVIRFDRYGFMTMIVSLLTDAFPSPGGVATMRTVAVPGSSAMINHEVVGTSRCRSDIAPNDVRPQCASRVHGCSGERPAPHGGQRYVTTHAKCREGAHALRTGCRPHNDCDLPPVSEPGSL